MSACSTCRQSKCVCNERTVLGLTVDITAPTGDDLVSGEPCESSSCSSTPVGATECCNYWKAREGQNGDSFFYNAGGPFQLPAYTDPVSYACPPVAGLVVLPTPDLTVTPKNAVNPGPLAAIICMNLPPGTYKFDATMQLHVAAPGTRVAIVYLPNCDDSTTEYLVGDCAIPCPPNCTTPVFMPLQDLMCSNFLVVANEACNPGFKVLVQTGTLQCGSGGTGFSFAAFIQNLQIVVERMTSRNLPACVTNPLITGTTRSIRCYTCGL